MEISVRKTLLIGLLARVGSIAAARDSVSPAMKCVALEGEGSLLRGAAINQTIAITGAVEAVVKKPGGILLHAGNLARIVRDLPSEEVQISVKDTKVEVRSGSSRYKLSGISLTERVGMKDCEDRLVEIKQPEFRSMLKQVVAAVSDDETRYILNAVYCCVHDGELRVVATDGRRLQVSTGPKVKVARGFAGLILPSKAIGELVKLLDLGDEARIFTSKTGRSVTFSIDCGPDSGFQGSVILTSLVVEGNYPDYQRVIPASGPTKFRVNRESTIQLLHRVALASGANGNVRLTFKSGRIEASASSADFGESNEGMEAITSSGPEIVMALNHRFFIQALSNITQDEVDLVLEKEDAALMIRAADRYVGIVMPVRLS